MENKYLLDNKRWHFATSIKDTLEIETEVPEMGIKSKTMFIYKDSPIALAIAQFIHNQIVSHRGADTCYVVSLNFIYIHGRKNLFEKNKCKLHQMQKTK